MIVAHLFICRYVGGGRGSDFAGLRLFYTLFLLIVFGGSGFGWFYCL